MINEIFFCLSKERETLTVTNKEPLRRFSLIPPGGGTPAINLTPDDGVYMDRNRRPSLQNMGQYNHVSGEREREKERERERERESLL